MDSQLELNAKDIITGLDNFNQRFSGKKILLTGAAGFFGSQFVHYFKVLNDSGILNAPCHLYAWDNYLRGIPYWMNDIKENSNDIDSPSDISMVLLDGKGEIISKGEFIKTYFLVLRS